MKWNILLLILLISCIACDRKRETQIAFYHWKSKAIYTESIRKTLQSTGAKKIYMHFFDVDNTVNDHFDLDGSFVRGGLYPIYPLMQVDSEYLKFDIIPVIFIVNQALIDADVNDLSDRIHSLADQISQHHFRKTFPSIQLDCDWNASTREKYFLLIRLLQHYYEVSVTIRLHQVKFQKETGIPPVHRGTLMLYNMGDLKNENQNSILLPDLVQEYINSSSTYPLEMDVALPLFSQTVLLNKQQEVRIVHGTNRDSILNDQHFRVLNDHLLEVTRDTLYKGFYLSPGYKLKFEELKEEEIISAYQVVKRSRLKVAGVIFYHLDDESLKKINLAQITGQL